MNGPYQGPPNPHGLSPEEEARLRDPRHPIHNGLVLYPVPNLIFTHSAKPHHWERYVYISWWMAKTFVWPHYTRAQKTLHFSGVFWMILTFTVLFPLLAGHLD